MPVRIALVAIHPYPSPQAVPLSNAFLKSYLSTQVTGVDIALHDFYLHQESIACAQKIAASRPDLVGFSLYTWNRTACHALATELSHILPHARLIAGGPEATADPAGVLAETPYEWVVAGEGEVPFTTLCRYLVEGKSVDGIPGIAVAGAGERLVPAAPLFDLDSIPSPWLNGTLDTRRYRGILWQLSRGCGFSCDFCFDSRGVHGVRRFSLERIEAELRYFADNGTSQVFVLDSTFNQDRERAKAILRMIAALAPQIHFHFEVRSEFIDREMADLFAAVTCSLQIGLQSADPQIMMGVGRSFKPADFRSKIGLLNQSGAIFGFDLIYGLPHDSLAGFRASLNFALDQYPNHLDIFPLAVLPGTALAAKSTSLGLVHHSPPPYTLISSPTFSSCDMEQAGRLAVACDIFYTRGKAVAWFNSVMRSLKLRPADFLELFATWLESQKGKGISEADLDDEGIWQLQREFLTSLYRTRKARKLLPLALDLVDYHHHYAAALLTPPPSLPDDHVLERLDLLNSPARLSPSVRLASFTYEILDILDAGEPELRPFCEQIAPTGSWAIIYPLPSGIQTESVIEPYFRLLKQLDGRTPCSRIARRLGIPDDETASFLAFAAADGIIITP